MNMAKLVESAYQEAFCDGVEQADYDSEIVERAWRKSSTKETLEKLSKQNQALVQTCAEAQVQAVFKNPDDGSEVHVSPEWMAECGTPITEAGDDMKYVGTKIETGSAKPLYPNNLNPDEVQQLIESSFDEGFDHGQKNADYDTLFKLHHEATSVKGNIDCWDESETKDKMQRLITDPESAFRPEHHVKNLALSTQHFSPDDNELLGQAADNPEAAVYDIRTGFLIHIECFLGTYSSNFFTAELINLLNSAKGEGFDYIHFDSDAPICHALPTFDW